MNTLILTCSTGQGHNSCANAIKEYYDLHGQPCVIEDALSFISPALSHVICWGHVTIYRHFHSLFQVGYRYSEKHSGLFREKSSVYHLLSRGTGAIRSYIVENKIDTVICTHVFASLMLTQLQKEAPLPIRTGLVATDYTCNPGTKESVVDRYFIPDPPLSINYECPAISEQRIISSGIPIRQAFTKQQDPAQAKKALGLDPGCVHLLMMCGSMGCGPMARLSKQIIRLLPENAAFTIICGTNQGLRKKLQRRYGGDARIHICGYVDNISQLMDSADLYLTKPGGISTTEAAAKGLPMVFIDAVAGCEEYNKIYFIKKGAAKTAAAVEDIALLCTELLKQPAVLRQMHDSLASLEQPNAAGVIFEEMNNLNGALKQ